jgi:NADH:ubiquinone oxidoreductase subunit 6 (subunit J)
MLIWLIVIIGVISVVVLNIEGTKTVSGSEIHSESEKRKYRLMIWALPLIGTFWAMWLINKDIRKKQHEMEDEIAPVIKELGDSLKKLESGIQRKHNKSKLH